MPDKQFEILIHQVGHRDRNLKGIAAVMGIPYATLAEQVNPDQIKKFGAGDLHPISSAPCLAHKNGRV